MCSRLASTMFRSGVVDNVSVICGTYIAFIGALVRHMWSSKTLRTVARCTCALRRSSGYTVVHDRALRGDMWQLEGGLTVDSCPLPGGPAVRIALRPGNFPHAASTLDGLYPQPLGPRTVSAAGGLLGSRVELARCDLTKLALVVCR